MGFRELAGDLARGTSGVWRGIAEMVDPVDARPPAAAPGADIDPVADDDPDGGAAGAAMLVPIDAWTRVLEQLGHLHEAGQQLADARERAARAETENRFLREQLREIKDNGRPRRASRPAPPADPPTPTELVSEDVWVESRRTRVRRHVSGWLSP